MIAHPAPALTELYERDETAWLEVMAELASTDRPDALDLPNLGEYLHDMARRERREVSNRLTLLLMHLLKWEHQPESRSGSWRGTIRQQRRELRALCESGTLWNHAEAVLDDAYSEARQQAADETGLALEVFPSEHAWASTNLLSEFELPA